MESYNDYEIEVNCIEGNKYNFLIFSEVGGTCLIKKYESTYNYINEVDALNHAKKTIDKGL